MATTTTANYSGHDYTAEFERLIALLPDEYTDRNHSDAGISITRLQASTSDGIYDVTDHVADEGFISYAQFRQSLIDLGLLVGYLPTLASGATTRLRLTRVDPEGTDLVTITKYTAFSRIDGVSYLTVADVSIPAGTQSVEVDAIQGTLVELEVKSDDFQTRDWTKNSAITSEKASRPARWRCGMAHPPLPGLTWIRGGGPGRKIGTSSWS